MPYLFTVRMLAWIGRAGIDKMGILKRIKALLPDSEATAQALFNSVAADNKDYPELCCMMGKHFSDQQNWKKALEYYKKVPSGNEFHDQVMYELANRYFKLNNLKKCIHYAKLLRTTSDHYPKVCRFVATLYEQAAQVSGNEENAVSAQLQALIWRFKPLGLAAPAHLIELDVEAAESHAERLNFLYRATLQAKDREIASLRAQVNSLSIARPT